MDVRHINDHQLFQRLRNGELAAFDVIYERYWDRLYRLVYKILQNRAASEDVVQDTFIKFWEKRDTIDNINILGYLSTISYHLLLKALEKEQLGKQLSQHLATAGHDEATTADQQLRLSELKASISSCVDALPPQCQAIYRLSREQNLPVKEIALILGLHPKTVENQITIALKRLRQAVAHLLVFLLVLLHY